MIIFKIKTKTEWKRVKYSFNRFHSLVYKSKKIPYGIRIDKYFNNINIDENNYFIFVQNDTSGGLEQIGISNKIMSRSNIDNFCKDLATVCDSVMRYEKVKGLQKFKEDIVFRYNFTMNILGRNDRI